MMTLTGFVLDGMTRALSWRFLSMGRRIERLATMCSALGVALDEGRDHELDWLLDLADSSITYRSRYLAAPEWLPVLDMVMRDETNPRSLAFQAKGLAEFIAKHRSQSRPLRRRDAGCRRTPRCARLRPADLDRRKRSAGRRPVAQLRRAAYAVSDDISLKFFSHAVPRSMLSLAARCWLRRRRQPRSGSEVALAPVAVVTGDERRPLHGRPRGPPIRTACRSAQSSAARTT